MSAMYAGIAFTVVISIPALVREIRLARRSDRPPAVPDSFFGTIRRNGRSPAGGVMTRAWAACSTATSAASSGVVRSSGRAGDA
jgi:hypothetical protein